jgi:hypothetical protein
MNHEQTEKYWIPKGVDEHLRSALSIPGEPPASPSEHLSRLEGLLAKLANEHDECWGPGEALRTAQEFVPDSNLLDQPDSISPGTLAYVLMNSDQLPSVAVFFVESGDYDEDYQDEY